MKMINPFLSVVLVGLIIILCSCSSGNGTKIISPIPPVHEYILASDLALKAAILNSSPDSMDCMHVQMLYSTSSTDNSQLSGSSTYAVSCCCPCNQAIQVKETDISNSDPLTQSYTRKYMQSAKDTTGHCPCPALMQWSVAAPSGAVTSMAIDDQAFESHSAPVSDSLVNATIFKLSHERTFSDGDHLLRIKGNFDGKGERNYALPIIVKNGMVYLKN